MKSAIINSQEKYRWITVTVNLIWVVLFVPRIIDSFTDYQIVEGALTLLLSLIILSFFDIKFLTKITGFKIEQGYKVGFLPKLFKMRVIHKNEFACIEIVQDSDKYFQICAIDTNGNSIILVRLPNLNPAKAELERIESLLESHWAIELPTAI